MGAAAGAGVGVAGLGLQPTSMSSTMMAENKRGAADMRAPPATAWFRGENSAQCIKDMRSLASQVGCPNCTHVRSTCAHVASQALAGTA